MGKVGGIYNGQPGVIAGRELLCRDRSLVLRPGGFILELAGPAGAIVRVVRVSPRLGQIVVRVLVGPVFVVVFLVVLIPVVRFFRVLAEPAEHQQIGQ